MNILKVLSRLTHHSIKPSFYPSLIVFYLLFSLWITLAGQKVFAQNSSTVQFQSFPHSQARLISSHQTVSTNQTIQLGLHIYFDQDWHSYWKNPGDSGATPSLQFKSNNAAVTFGDIVWPNPVRIDTPPLTSFAYEEELLLTVPMTYTGTGQNNLSLINIRLDAEWLVCKEECVPAFGQFELQLNSALELQVNNDPHIHTLFKNISKSLPQDYQQQYILIDSAAQTVLQLPLNQELIDPSHQYDFFLFQADHLSNQKPQVELQDNTVLLTFEKLHDQATQTISGTLHIQTHQASKPDVYINILENSGQTQRLKIKQAVSINQPIGLMILFAFIGGVLLNFMPCVFPIISLKLIALIHAADNSLRSVRKDAGLFILGCLSCFAIIASLIVVLKHVGLSLGWGFQLQSPVFILCLSFVFLLLSLSFIDLIYIELPWLSQLSTKTSVWKNTQSYITGFLAVLLATPCSAPFMGVSIGYALGQNTLYIFSVFLSLGLGFALPYLYILCFPKKIPALPKSGPWLLTFKRILFFPMLATLLWLAWIYGQQQSLNQMFWLLLTLLFFSSLVFLMKHKTTLAPLFFSLLLLMNTSITLFALYKTLPSSFSAQQSSNNSADKDFWLTFSPKELQSQLDQQRNVFLDFTADWCITCKVNESLTLENRTVRQYIQEKNIVMMKADWTRYDPVITDFLKTFDRASVPFYLYYPYGSEAIILPEILTPQLFIDTLEKSHQK